MTPWTSDELDAIGNADEVTPASPRRDGTLRRPVTMWVGRAGGRHYPSIVPSIAAPEAQAATLKLVPKED